MAVDWYGDRILLQIGDASAEMLTKAAFLIEGQAKINITNNGQVDTGFMRNSVYANAPNGEHAPEGADGRYHSRKEQRSVERKSANPVQPDNAKEAVVGVAASYAIYQESDNPFLYPAVVDVASQMSGQIVDAGKGLING